MFNRSILIGRLTKDPECRYTPAGKAVCSFRLAVDRGYGDNKEADFVNIVAWEKLAETVTNNLQKGRLVLVEGRLQIRQYEKDGQKREAAEVVANTVRFLDHAKGKETQDDLGDLNLDDLPM